MKTVQATATVTPDHQLNVHVQAPADVPAGQHPVVVVIGAPGPESDGTPSCEWPAHDAGLTPPGRSLRREALYGDDAR